MRVETDAVMVRKIVFYKFHDVKMIYLLTQKLLWNNNHHTFLIHGFKTLYAVHEINKSCGIIPHEYQVSLYYRSKDICYRARTKHGYKYTSDSHRYWLDKQKFGISHYSIHPDHLRCDCIPFYVFCLSSYISRQIMNYLQSFMRY